MENSTIDDEDMPILSESTLLALQQFYAEKKIRDCIEETDYLKVNEASENLIQEDWNLSQFWYTEKTASILAEECIKLAGSDSRIACLCSPTVFRVLFNRKSTEFNAYLFEFDRRFEKMYGQNFVFYDYKDCPREKCEHLRGIFDVLLIDPPFLSDECFRKVRQFVNFLSHENSKLIVCSGAIMEDAILELFKANPCQNFRPEHVRKLGNEFYCYLNYVSEDLS
uniref:Protein-lysine N-methyltransferase n=1 Tax=Romanomermis culicivorax TaxID=13658 RepID=A0A915HKV5_ROMCU